MLSREQYFEYYEKNGKTIDQSQAPNQGMNKRQLETKYKKYLKGFDKKDFTKDTLWIDVREAVYKRDGQTCRLLPLLAPSEIKELQIKSRGQWKIITPAHILGKGSFPHLKYDIDNVVTLNQYSHSMLDNCCHPIMGKLINREERDNWWRFIVGNDLYNSLMSRAYSKEERNG